MVYNDVDTACSSCVCFLGFNLSVKVIVQCVLAGAHGVSSCL